MQFGVIDDSTSHFTAFDLPARLNSCNLDHPRQRHHRKSNFLILSQNLSDLEHSLIKSLNFPGRKRKSS